MELLCGMVALNILAVCAGNTEILYSVIQKGLMGGHATLKC